MKVKMLIEELQKLPEHATVRILIKDNEDFCIRSYAHKVVLQPIDDNDDYCERYVYIM